MTYVKKSDIISIYNPAGDEPQPDWFKEALKNGKIQITTISLSTDPPYIKEEYSIENLHLGTMSHGLRDRHAFARDCYGNIWFIELELLDRYQPIALVKKYDRKKDPVIPSLKRTRDEEIRRMIENQLNSILFDGKSDEEKRKIIKNIRERQNDGMRRPIIGPYGTAFDVKLDESIGKVELKAQEN